MKQPWLQICYMQTKREHHNIRIINLAFVVRSLQHRDQQVQRPINYRRLDGHLYRLKGKRTKITYTGKLLSSPGFLQAFNDTPITCDQLSSI